MILVGKLVLIWIIACLCGLFLHHTRVGGISTCPGTVPTRDGVISTPPCALYYDEGALFIFPILNTFHLLISSLQESRFLGS